MNKNLPPSPRKLPTSNVNPAFRYFGIPPSVLAWRPKIPSRNWSIFWAILLTSSSYWYYDRRECRSIREEYKKEVAWIGKTDMKTPLEWPRRCTVVATSVWDDGDEGRSVTWFKRHVKPYLIAAGMDLRIIHGTRPGDLARIIHKSIIDQRILLAVPETSSLTPQEEALRDTEGGVIVMGRQALKEYFWALRRGWTDVIDVEEELKIQAVGVEDREQERIVRELAKEDEMTKGPFDDATESIGTSGRMSFPPQGMLPPYQPAAPKPLSTSQVHTILPPDDFPRQPPLLLVPFVHPVGLRFWPRKIFRWFNRRFEAREGAEAALMLIQNQTRPVSPPSSMSGLLREEEVQQVRAGRITEADLNTAVGSGLTGSVDLDFLYEPSEAFHARSTLLRRPSQIHVARTEYYEKTLPPLLRTTRELSRHLREPTKQEVKYPPKSEAELRQQRVDNERRWRNELEGWAIVRRGSGIAWTDGMEVLNTFRHSTEEERAHWSEEKRHWEEVWARRESQFVEGEE
ncbi:hypothetical protein BT69DRAFT_1286721 [Atractiella rhizophila]|nr:hypothetical protein BT69DRAFT_1286721 [Atractiella rhizophila]